MFDTMTLTKIVGGFCGALLVYLLGVWAADALYHTGGGGHGDHGSEQAYVIPVEGGDAAGGATGPVGNSFFGIVNAHDGNEQYR